jgi:hypothetical protein
MAVPRRAVSTKSRACGAKSHDSGAKLRSTLMSTNTKVLGGTVLWPLTKPLTNSTDLLYNRITTGPASPAGPFVLALQPCEGHATLVVIDAEMNSLSIQKKL